MSSIRRDKEFLSNKIIPIVSAQKIELVDGYRSEVSSCTKLYINAIERCIANVYLTVDINPSLDTNTLYNVASLSTNVKKRERLR